MSRDADLDAADDALANGDPETALRLLARLPEDDAERALLAGEALVELGELTAAEDELARAERLGADEEAVCALRAELHLRAWRPREARALFESLLAQSGGYAVEDAPLHERVALCLDLEGDPAAADAALARAARCDPEVYGSVPHLDDDALDAVIADALARLPQRYRAVADLARIVIEPVPTRPPDDDPVWRPDLLGLFDGETLGDLAEEAALRLPPRIFLFQRNLERTSRTRAELEHEIRTTLYHELGHLLGLDEDEVDALGLA